MLNPQSVLNGLSKLHNHNDRIKFLKGLEVTEIHLIGQYMGMETYVDGKNLPTDNIIAKIALDVNVKRYSFTLTGEVEAAQNEHKTGWKYITTYNKIPESHDESIIYDNEYEALAKGKERLAERIEADIIQALRSH